jgi:hypothetical protein
VETDLAPFSDARNNGTYGITYLAPEKVFVSSLSITNNGTAVESDWKNGAPPGVTHMPVAPPADKGWCEYEFRVMATTNYQGFTFPLRAVARYLLPTWERDALRLRVKVEVEIETVGIGPVDEPGIGDVKVPNQLFATDWRPPWDALERGFNFVVTNDVWELASDRRR